MGFLRKIKAIFSLSSYNPAQLFVIGFALIILLGAIILSMPISTVDGKGLHFIDALFTATSATCVTGLVVVDTGTTFTLFGQIVVLSLIQIGGLGFMTVATLFALMLGKKISFKQRILMQESLNLASLEGVVRLVRHVITVTLILEGIGALLLALRFIPQFGFGKGIYFGIFHSVSNFNNAGFDVFGNFQSLTQFVDDPVVNIVIMLLIIFGGLGFYVIAELLKYPKKRRLSMHSKVVLATSAILVFGGALLIFIIEFTNTKTLASLNWSGKIFGSLFQSIATRTDGANTLPIGEMRQASLFFMIMLMFIGASPGSTGGGIKTTTFITLLGALWAIIRGKRDVVFFKQRVAEDKIYKALAIAMLALFMVITITLILTLTEEADFLTILFETTSAFGTVGLSMGLTPHLTMVGKIIISFMMFAGRLGPLTVAFALSANRKDERFRHSEGKIMIG